MSVEERLGAGARVLAARDRYVSRGVSTSRLVVDRAAGATIWDADGRELLNFGGGIACQNLGHGPERVVRAIHEQADRFLHQCFMVGMYEPYVEVCRRLDELWPGNAETKSLLVNSGAEAVENAVKIARAATGRPAVVVFDRAFHGRTTLTMAMTSKLVYKQGFGPLAPEVYRAPAPYPYRGVTTEDALHGLELLFKQDVDPASVACLVLEPVQGEGGFIPMPPEFVQALRRICDDHGIFYVDDDDIVYVPEHNAGMVSILNLDGERLATWGDGPQMRSCHGIWCDSNRDLYVVQPGAWQPRARRVVKYTRQ